MLEVCIFIIFVQVVWNHLIISIRKLYYIYATGYFQAINTYNIKYIILLCQFFRFRRNQSHVFCTYHIIIDVYSKIDLEEENL